jgi:HAD superfamily hydrolase (TIGR01450 family)
VASVGAGVAAVSLSLEESEPHPAASRAKEAIRTARWRDTAGKDNGRRVPLSPAVRPYDHLLLDLDGTVWLGDAALPGAVDAVAALREAGKAVLFVTNDVRQAPEAFVRKLWGLGFQASVGEVLSAGAALQYFLAENAGHRSAYVVGARALVDHVAEAGLRIVNRTPFAPRADVVVVGGHDRLAFEELKIATQAVLRGAELIGATRDATFPMPDGLWPGTGAVLAAIETATGRKASHVVGKPEPPMYAAALDRLGPGRVLAIGDRLDADIEGARRSGFHSALVLTGVTSRAEADTAKPRPTYVADSLAALVLGGAPS